MSQHVFSEVPQIKVPRSKFRRPFNLKTTLGTDFIYPIYCDEALPGDSFKFSAKFFARLSTPIVPVMDDLYLDTFFFAVPIRLVDKNFRRVMGEHLFGDNSTEFFTPVLSTGDKGIDIGSLSDYIGIPPFVPNLDFVPYWHRAYNLIYNEWFRAQDICPPVKVAGVSEDGSETTEALSDYQLLKRCKRFDYFTSATPWVQKGDPVSLGMGGLAPVVGSPSGLGMTLWDGTYKSWLLNTRSSATTSAGAMGLAAQVGGIRQHASDPLGLARDYNVGDHNAQAVDLNVSKSNGVAVVNFPSAQSGFASNVFADLSAAPALSINALREAVAIQELLEKDLFGTRLIELIRVHFGVVSPDARMQRPEYLGGFSQRMNVTTVPQTSSTDSTSPQGNLAAFVTVSERASWIKSFTEHCVILGLCNVRAELSYQQGLPRMFSRRSRYDFYWPSLANLGQQAILNKEIFAQGSSVLTPSGSPVDDEPFGYQERWAEYRYHPSMITGLFRSVAPQSLDYWHLAQKFENLPTLSADFIEENVPIQRIVAVQDEPPIILDANFDVECSRPMPLYSVPHLGSRF